MFTAGALTSVRGRWERLAKSYAKRREIATRVKLNLTMDTGTWGRVMWQTSLQLESRCYEPERQAGWNDCQVLFLPLTKIPCCNHCDVQPPKCKFYEVIATYCNILVFSFGFFVHMWPPSGNVIMWVRLSAHLLQIWKFDHETAAVLFKFSFITVF